MAQSKPAPHYGKWRIRWTDENGNRHSEVHEKYEDAKYALNRHEVLVQEIKRGLLLPTIPDKTFGDAADYWIEKRVIHKRSAAADISMIKNHLRPFFGSILLKRISAFHIDNYIDSKGGELDPKTVYNQLTLFTSILNLAVDLSWLAKAPKIRKPKIILNDSDFCYLRDEEEIDIFLNAAAAEGDDVHATYSFPIYGGPRQGEVAGLKKKAVDLKNRIITIEKSFSGPPKNGITRYIPILDPLLPIFIKQMDKSGSDFVFPNKAGNMHQPSARIFQDVLHRVLRRAGFPTTEHEGKIKRYITFHDLRHTFASLWVKKGLDIFRLQKLLGHKSIQVTMRYAHLAPNAFVSDYSCLSKDQTNLGGEVIALRR